MLDTPNLDTWLARHLLEQGQVELSELQQLVAEARVNRRTGGPTLAQSLIRKGLIGEEQVLKLLGELSTNPTGAPGQTPTPQPEDGTPPQLGGYRLLQRLGAGGMGTVYLGEHLETGARHAVKVLDTTDPELVTRFSREGQAQARVGGHPNVVTVHSSGSEGGRFFLAMNLATGGDLDRRLKALGPLAPQAACALVADLARGLEHVHAQGVLHRDLKPANVLFDEHDTPKLVDFGLARIAGAGTLTASGTLMGTPAYMAPEQADTSRGPTDERSDIYGLGAILYETLTGRPPFLSASIVATLSQVLSRPPTSPRELRPEIPPALESVCLKALEKKPGDRYPSAAALADALEASTLPRTARSDWIAPLAGMGVAVALLAIVAALFGNVETAAPNSLLPELPESAVNSNELEAQGPSWWAKTPSARRPELPLPSEIEFGEGEGEYVNTADGSILVYVPGGRFRMGDNSTRLADGPEHDAELDGYFIGKYELTQKAYARFCRATGREARLFEEPKDDHPAYYVSWDDAVAYCEWANLRLPNEAEWEYAARGSDARAWPWGDELPRKGGRLANLLGTGTSAVGAFPKGASPFGCLDMAGNVREWVQDPLLAYAPDPHNLRASQTKRVTRGGSWGEARLLPLCRTFSRESHVATRRLVRVGLRVARSATALGPQPAWWARVPLVRRPPLPLPSGIEFGDEENEYVNSREGSILVYVPGGVFEMGGDPENNYLETAQGMVKVDGFFVGKFEVTLSAYEKFCADTQREISPARGAGPNHPVERVNWNDAFAYCKWAGLRLPAEAEWEFAARGLDGREWPWGNEAPDGSKGFANLGIFDGIQSVGSFPRGVSPFGCHDMAGNVAEWVHDRPSHVDRESEIYLSEKDYRVYRGGMANDSNFLLRGRAFNRNIRESNLRDAGMGFRVAGDGR